MKPGDIINPHQVQDGSLVRDGEGDYYIRYGIWGHMPFAVSIRPWCGWDERMRLPWKRVRGRLQIVAQEIPVLEATGENLRRVAEAFEQEEGKMGTWESEAILTTVTSCPSHLRRG